MHSARKNIGPRGELPFGIRAAEKFCRKTKEIRRASQRRLRSSAKGTGPNMPAIRSFIKYWVEHILVRECGEVCYYTLYHNYSCKSIECFLHFFFLCVPPNIQWKCKEYLGEFLLKNTGQKGKYHPGSVRLGRRRGGSCQGKEGGRAGPASRMGRVRRICSAALS